MANLTTYLSDSMDNVSGIIVDNIHIVFVVGVLVNPRIGVSCAICRYVSN